MKKLLSITWKDLLILFHDRAALIFMLLAPFVLTLGIGAVGGAFTSSGSQGIQSIPIVVANQDRGPLGPAVVALLVSENMNGLFSLSETDDVHELRRLIEADQAAAGVIIPADYSAAVIPALQDGRADPDSPIEVYLNPARPISSGIVLSVVTELAEKVEGGPQENLIQVMLTAAEEPVTQEGASVLAYMAPGMAVFFLMYTVTQGGRGILAEKQMGTLTRMLASPTHPFQVLGGKVASVFAAGFLQVSVLVLAAALLFGLDWGNPLGVAALIGATAAAATGWGILLASYARSAAQVSSLGTAMMLIFGVLGGSFIPTSEFSPAIRWVSRLTPNAWALEGFEVLARGGQVSDLLEIVVALLVMAGLLFGLSILIAQRRWFKGYQN